MPDPPKPPLDSAELRLRRRGARMRRRRRRVAASAGLMFGVAVITLLLTSPGAHPAASHAVATAAHSAPARRGVSHRSSGGEGSAEVAAIRKATAANDYVSRGSPRRMLVALTFDDGPGPTTPRLLRWLNAHHVPATFFVIGRNAAAHPDVVRAEVAAGDVVGDHTQTHAFLGRLSTVDQQAEITSGARAISTITGARVRLFRPPYGSFDASTLQLLRGAGLLMVLWTVDTKDFSRPGTKRIVFTALSGARAGSIVLMHDGGGDRRQTLAALPRIVHHLRIKGYRLVTVPKLLVADPVPPDQPPPRSLAGG